MISECRMNQKRAVAIIIVWGILVMLAMLAMAAVRLMGNQGSITENSVRRIKAYYTAKAAMVKALEDCRLNPATCVDGATQTITLNNLTAKVAITDSMSAPCDSCKMISIDVDY